VVNNNFFLEYLDYLNNLTANILTLFGKIWHYKLFIMDGQNVSIANFIAAIICMIFGLRLAKYLNKLIYNKLIKPINLEANITNLLGKIFHFFLIIIVVVIVLDIAHVPLTIFTFLGGAFAVSIGVGGQHVVNNFISGIILMIENPINIGDIIEVGKSVGTVESIDARSVKIKTYYNTSIYIPHSIILQNELIKWSANDNKVRLFTNLSVKHGDIPITELKEIIMFAVNQNKNVLAAPKPQILLTSFYGDALVLEVNFFVNLLYTSRKNALSEINCGISEVLTKHNIKLADNT
jgi:potassium efflux system protein